MGSKEETCGVEWVVEVVWGVSFRCKGDEKFDFLLSVCVVRQMKSLCFVFFSMRKRPNKSQSIVSHAR